MRNAADRRRGADFHCSRAESSWQLSEERRCCRSPCWRGARSAVTSHRSSAMLVAAASSTQPVQQSSPDSLFNKAVHCGALPPGPPRGGLAVRVHRLHTPCRRPDLRVGVIRQRGNRPLRHTSIHQQTATYEGQRTALASDRRVVQKPCASPRPVAPRPIPPCGSNEHSSRSDGSCAWSSFSTPAPSRCPDHPQHPSTCARAARRSAADRPPSVWWSGSS
eukprot:COSAG04_NODE_1351_length_7119_cov_17.943447_1_plen_220_part_00